MQTFRAFVAERDGDQVRREIRTLTEGDLPPGEVTIEVAFSGVNYKDALATVPNGQVARISPLVPGIDLAGEVRASTAEGVGAGDWVLVHGLDLGSAHHGGFAELARVPADWVVPLPAGMSPRNAMALGTAGFTAGLSLVQLEERGLRPEDGPVLVTGATGGVGSVAVAILAARGYEVTASTGKRDVDGYLRGLGAREVIAREETSADGQRPLESQRWAAVLDSVGGATLAYALRTLRRHGAVASSGMTGGTAVHTTVMPFILRGVALVGVDSAYCPMERRRMVWKRLADDLRPLDMASLVREISLDEVESAIDAMLSGQARGRTVLRLAP